MVHLKSVCISSDVHSVCTTHALTTEVEEVMGLLIGCVNRETGVCTISETMQLERLDKRKDRVEISDDQLSSAFPLLDQLNAGRGVGCELSVIGWYHSHPHITVFPSHVDVSTQRDWEIQDPMWVGLIFGVFTSDSNHDNRLSVIAFQSKENYRKMQDPVSNVGVNQTNHKNSVNEKQPPPRRRIVANAPAYETSNGASTKYQLIPVRVLPKRKTPCCPDPQSMKAVQNFSHVLLKEMDKSYEKATRVRNEPVTRLHNSCVAAQSRCKLLDRLIKPTYTALSSRT